MEKLVELLSGQIDAMLLSNTLIVLDQQELEDMRSRYKDNDTMIRLLDAYAEKYDIEPTNRKEGNE